MQLVPIPYRRQTTSNVIRVAQKSVQHSVLLVVEKFNELSLGWDFYKQFQERANGSHCDLSPEFESIFLDHLKGTVRRMPFAVWFDRFCDEGL